MTEPRSPMSGVLGSESPERVPDERTFGPYECRDKGHEFRCRYGVGACSRRGPGTCNDDPEDEA